MKLLVTGASGYIGAALLSLLRQAGREAIAAGRRPVAGLPWHAFDLEGAQIAPLPPGVDAVVHLAADTSGNPDPALHAREVTAARALLEAAQAAGARMVFVSSQTARPDAPTRYGRTKWEIERLVLAAGGVVVRPGQVYGGPERGLFGTLVALVRRLPVLPAFVPDPPIQPVHVDDLACALLAAAERPALEGRVLGVAASEPVGFTQFLRVIAGERVRRPRLFVPVPALLVRALDRATGGRIASLARLGSLFALPALDCADDLARLGITLRPLEQGMSRGARPHRRALLRESAALLHYVLGQRPGPALVRRQARVLEQVRDGQPLGLPALACRMPALMRSLETRGGSARALEFAWRLDCATALAEATPQGARRFLGLGGGSGTVRAALGLAGALAAEVFWRTGGRALRPLLRWA